MEIEGDEDEIPMPLNSAYPGVGGAHLHVSSMLHQYHHHHHHGHGHHGHHVEDPSSNGGHPVMPITPRHHDHQVVISNNNNNNKHGGDDDDDDHTAVQVKYKECLKNHAASMGGNVKDGCGEFMASNDEALICSVCTCHRNFHRREVGGGGEPWKGKGVIQHHKNILSPAGRGVAIIPYSMGPLLAYPSGQSDGQDEAGGGGAGSAAGGAACMGFPPAHHKKRFRTRFTQEQKGKMLSFAEKIGWTIQKQEESAIQRFCQEIGVKRKVLKVWLHNNKHNFSKNTSLPINPNGCEEEKHSMSMP